jgi:hypothetical protein
MFFRIQISFSMVFMTFAGTPPTKVLSGTSLLITAPAATTTLLPMVTSVDGVENLALPDGLGLESNQFLVGIRVLDSIVTFIQVSLIVVVFVGRIGHGSC